MIACTCDSPLSHLLDWKKCSNDIRYNLMRWRGITF